MVQIAVSEFLAFLKRVSRPGVVIALTLPLGAQAVAIDPAAPGTVLPDAPAPDSRIDRLAKFFRARRSALSDHAADFIEAADKHKLDWRLLPSLAMIETGGRPGARNNVFGWASGRARFDSIRESIFTVARALDENRPYRGKDLRAKLRAYNPVNRGYADIVFRIFRQISPEEPGLAAGAGR